MLAQTRTPQEEANTVDSIRDMDYPELVVYDLPALLHDRLFVGSSGIGLLDPTLQVLAILEEASLHSLCVLQALHSPVHRGRWMV